jgi:hypothetical protein
MRNLFPPPVEKPREIYGKVDLPLVGDTEGGPKGDILGQAGAVIGTEHCLEFPA